MVTLTDNLRDMHWLLRIVHDIDVGLVVLDADYRVRLWNGFMEHHSGRKASEVVGGPLFQLFPDVPEEWLRRKVEAVFLLRNRAFATWHQRPYLFRFDGYRPITGEARWMYQNLTIFPLLALNGEVEQVCLMVEDVTEMALDEAALQQANSELARLGRTDGLTGLNNRRAWEELLAAEFKRHRRGGQPGVLALFDIDHFKQINDTFGHLAGDEVIRTVARVLNEVRREYDFAGRYGGEEFGVIIADTDLAGAQVFAERLRERIADATVQWENRVVRFTISIGLAALGSRIETPAQWLDFADRALYASKGAGRNRTSVFPPV